MLRQCEMKKTLELFEKTSEPVGIERVKGGLND